MMYPFLTLDDGTEVVHSDMQPNGQVRVYFERPDEELCFRCATCMLPSYSWSDVKGFEEGDLARFQEIVESCAHLIMEFAVSGGFDRASGF